MIKKNSRSADLNLIQTHIHVTMITISSHLQTSCKS